MKLSIVQQDIFTATADALFLSIDGAAHGMEGRLVRTFGIRFPDADLEEELDSQI